MRWTIPHSDQKRVRLFYNSMSAGLYKLTVNRTEEHGRGHSGPKFKGGSTLLGRSSRTTVEYTISQTLMGAAKWNCQAITINQSELRPSVLDNFSAAVGHIQKLITWHPSKLNTNVICHISARNFNTNTLVIFQEALPYLLWLVRIPNEKLL